MASDSIDSGVYVRSDASLHYETLDESLHYRIFRTTYAASEPYFGKFKLYRFDSPTKEFGTLYCAELFKTCFCETLIRNSVGLRVRASDFQDRSLSLLVLKTQSLRIVSMYGDHARNLGLDHADLIGKDYAITQRIASDVFHHADKPHGMLYQSRFNSPALAVVLFDRARDLTRPMPGFRPQKLADCPELAESVRQKVRFSIM